MPRLWWEGGPTLSTEKDCILTEYLAWHAGATFVYNYGLWTDWQGMDPTVFGRLSGHYLCRIEMIPPEVSHAASEM
jgi:hypothetical protein